MYIMAFKKPTITPARSKNLMKRMTHFCMQSIIYIVTGVSLFLLSFAYGANIPYVFTIVVFVFIAGGLNILCSSGYKTLSWILSVTPLLVFLLFAFTNRIPALFDATSLYLNAGQRAVQGAGQAGLGAVQGAGQAGLGAVQGVGQAGLGAVQGVGQAGLGGVQGVGQSMGMGMPTSGMPMEMPTSGMPTSGMPM